MANITELQTELLERLKEIDPSLEIRWDDTRGIASLIKCKIKSTETSPVERVEAFLKDFGPLVGPDTLPKGLRLIWYEPDPRTGWDSLLYGYMVDHEIEFYGSKLTFGFKIGAYNMVVNSNLWRDGPPFVLEPRVLPEMLREQLIQRIEGMPDFDRLKKLEGQQPDFPLTDPPRLVVFPWKGQFHLAWTSYGYSDSTEVAGRQDEKPYLTYGHIFVDALTGERIMFAPTEMNAETPDTAFGNSVTPLSGGFTRPSLNVVRVDGGSTYRLKDTNHERDIITYDVANSTSYDEKSEIWSCLQAGSLPVSEDTEGDKDWNCLPGDTTSAQRTLGQQPEVDAHTFVREQYEWYRALDGRLGWDDRRHLFDPMGNPIPDRYPDPPVADLPVRALAHYLYYITGNPKEINAFAESYKSGGHWGFWLKFCDADHATYEYIAGSRFIVAHEYQHIITNCSFIDAGGNPGLDYSNWFGAVHEGLSDVFGILSSEQWLPGLDISPHAPPLIFRNLVYPRDTAAYDANKLDHYDDRSLLLPLSWSQYYRHGTILAHCAYLMGKGGVHQRVGRTAGPALIPVYGLGSQAVGGMSILKAARIWYHALDKHCATISNDESSFRTIRDACVQAAEDLYGVNSKEYCTTVLAFYAVGLQPIEPPHYGPDVTFLRWGIDWDLSRGYVGLSSSDYTSLDLFINNGGVSEWNAKINVIDPATGLPTTFENTIYCRVRNVGDQAANNVKVTFDYAKAGTATWTWQPVLDKNGNPQTFTLASLAAGSLNFADADQNTPPAAAAVKWCIPPLAVGETIHHFCLRATVTADNDVNPYNNDVQSNIMYTAYVPGGAGAVAFIVGNPPQLERRMSLDLRVKTLLPKSWRVDIQGVQQGQSLAPGEMQVAKVTIDLPPAEDPALQMPLDGDVRGEASGDLSGKFTGTLTDVVLPLVIIPRRGKLTGQFSGMLADGTTLCGHFEGRISPLNRTISGTVTGPHPIKPGEVLTTKLQGQLRPWRRVEISQWHGDLLIGGITVQVQVSWPRGGFSYKLPPTDTEVKP